MDHDKFRKNLREQRGQVQRVNAINAEQALRFSKAAMLGCCNEFEKGHKDCAQFKLEASSVWLAIHEASAKQEALQPPSARLGMASTRELLHELSTRFLVSTPNEAARNEIDVMAENLDNSTLEYRTSGSESDPVA